MSGIDCMHIIMAPTRTYTETRENSEEAGTIIYKNLICHCYHCAIVTIVRIHIIIIKDGTNINVQKI